MNTGKLVAAGLAAYAVTLVAQAPATLVDARLRESSEGRIRLTQARGTIWNGAGMLEIRDPASRNAIAQPASWRILAESLWGGRLEFEITLDQTGKRFPVSASLSGIEISNAEIALPASALAFADPRLNPLGLTGDLLFSTKTLSIGKTGILGEARLQWRSAGSGFSPVAPMGSYELRLDGKGDFISGILTTLEGPLQLDGTGSWKSEKAPEIHATLRVPPQYREQLTPLLKLISVQRDEGSFELQLR